MATDPRGMPSPSTHGNGTQERSGHPLLTREQCGVLAEHPQPAERGWFALDGADISPRTGNSHVQAEARESSHGARQVSSEVREGQQQGMYPPPPGLVTYLRRDGDSAGSAKPLRRCKKGGPQ